jgi:Arc/MetJ-type ribon-helix-helix transcriptional regulator
MNIELTPEQVEFIERALASGQYGSVEEVLSQIVAIGMKEVTQQVDRETELRSSKELYAPALAQNSCEDTELTSEYEEFVKAMAEARGRSKSLRACFGELIE